MQPHVYYCEWCGEEKDPGTPAGHEECIEALGYEFPERPVLVLLTRAS